MGPFLKLTLGYTKIDMTITKIETGNVITSLIRHATLGIPYQGPLSSVDSSQDPVSAVIWQSVRMPRVMT